MCEHILFIAKRNPATSLGVRKANSEPAEIVAGKSWFHLLYWKASHSHSEFSLRFQPCQITLQDLVGLLLDPARGLSNNLKPSAVDKDFVVPPLAVVLVVRPASERIAAPFL